MVSITTFQQLELLVETSAPVSQPFPGSKKKLRFQLLLFHPVGAPTRPTRSTHEQYIQVCAEIKDRAAKENHPSRQVAADARYTTNTFLGL